PPVIPGCCDQSHGSDQSQDGPVIENVLGNGKVIVQILSQRQYKKPQVNPNRPALGEEVLIPGQILHAESGCGRAAQNKPDESQPQQRAGSDRNVKLPVPPDSLRRKARIPEVIG